MTPETPEEHLSVEESFIHFELEAFIHDRIRTTKPRLILDVKQLKLSFTSDDDQDICLFVKDIILIKYCTLSNSSIVFDFMIGNGGNEHISLVFTLNCCKDVNKGLIPFFSQHVQCVSMHFIDFCRYYDEILHLIFYKVPNEVKAEEDGVNDPPMERVEDDVVVMEDDEPSQSTDITCRFKDGSTFKMPQETLKKATLPSSWFCDLIMEFALENLYKNVLTSEQKQVVHVYNSFLFANLFTKRDRICMAEYEGMGKILNMCDLLDYLYPRRRSKKPVIPFFDKRLLVIPIFWENHWLLLLVQDLRNVIFDLSRIYDDIPPCRLIIIDSKINDPANVDILKRIHNRVFNVMKTWIRMMVFTQLNEVPTDNFSLIRCEDLPNQTNNNDCGVFVIRYASLFSVNLEWMNLPDEKIRHMTVPDENKFAQDILQFRPSLLNIVESLSS